MAQIEEQDFDFAPVVAIDDASTDVNANSGGLIVRSDAGVGVGDAIETSVARVDVENVAAGAIHVSESDSVVVEALSQLNAGEILFESIVGTVEVLASGAGVIGNENVRVASLGEDVLYLCCLSYLF